MSAFEESLSDRQRGLGPEHDGTLTWYYLDHWLGEAGEAAPDE
ncbi:hypothetical protein [Streptomyces sp. TLI_171]|nr:hypothetical protein [Streptomyces sp. TLI_171]